MFKYPRINKEEDQPGRGESLHEEQHNMLFPLRGCNHSVSVDEFQKYISDTFGEEDLYLRRNGKIVFPQCLECYEKIHLEDLVLLLPHKKQKVTSIVINHYSTR